MSDQQSADGAENEQKDDVSYKDRKIWLRGLMMIIFALFFGIAETLLFAGAVIQFFWMLFTGNPNRSIANFGDSLGRWLHAVAKFQTGSTEDKPFPWRDWE